MGENEGMFQYLKLLLIVPEAKDAVS